MPTDADANSTITYALGGTDAASFNLDSSSGVLTFKTAPDYETDQRNYTITVTSSDGTNTSDQTIAVTIDDVNDNAPVFTSSAAVTIEENKTAVTTLATTDARYQPNSHLLNYRWS